MHGHHDGSRPDMIEDLVRRVLAGYGLGLDGNRVDDLFIDLSGAD